MVAEETGMAFLSVSAAEIVTKWQGESGKNAKAMFDVLRSHKRCILFLDEIDSIATSRSTKEGQSSGDKHALTQILVQFGNIQNKSADIVLIAATNLPESLDSAFLRRFSTYLHVAQPTKEDRIEILKNVANGFHSLTTEDFSNLGDMTNHYSAADIARAGIDSINWYYQELLIATRFKETPDKDGKMKFEPCTINEKGTAMTYKDLEDIQLHHRRLTFHCMEEVLRQSRPTIESSEVNKHRRFEMKHPGVSIFRRKENSGLKEKEEVHKSEKRTLTKIFKSIFNKHEIEKKNLERDSVKTSAQSNTANITQRLSLFKSSKDH